MTAKIERIAAKTVFDPPAYTQTIKANGAETILFISGQADYDAKGQPGHPGDFAAQARAAHTLYHMSHLYKVGQAERQPEPLIPQPDFDRRT